MTDRNAKPELFTAANPMPGVVVGKVHGEVDLHNSPALRGQVMDALKKWQPKKLILNMKEVPYADSSAIAVLVEALKELRRTGGRIVLAELQSRVKGILEINRLDSIFGIAKDETEAMEK